MIASISQRAEIIRLLTCDLCDRAEEHEKALKKARKDGRSYLWAGYDFDKGEGIGKAQLHADIVQLRRMLALLDKEIQK
jgi:hypothetical protein